MRKRPACALLSAAGAVKGWPGSDAYRLLCGAAQTVCMGSKHTSQLRLSVPTQVAASHLALWTYGSWGRPQTKPPKDIFNVHFGKRTRLPKKGTTNVPYPFELIRACSNCMDIQLYSMPDATLSSQLHS